MQRFYGVVSAFSIFVQGSLVRVVWPLAECPGQCLRENSGSMRTRVLGKAEGPLVANAQHVFQRGRAWTLHPSSKQVSVSWTTKKLPFFKQSWKVETMNVGTSVSSSPVLLDWKSGLGAWSFLVPATGVWCWGHIEGLWT